MNYSNVNVFKIKDGKLETWREWCNQLNTTRRSEAMAALEQEGVNCEFFAIFKIKDHYYTLGAEIGGQTGGTLNPEDSEINATHKKIKEECLEYIGPGNFSYLLGL